MKTTTTSTTSTATQTETQDCCNEQNKTVIGNCVNNVITLPCPFAGVNGISDKIAHVSVFMQNYTPQSPSAIVSITELKVLAVERTVGYNVTYKIEVENAVDGEYQVLFNSASFVPHNPPMGYGGPQIVGDIG
ncbi:hypothetical protein WAF17_02570 [Bernardetia sp. ABR2-2B]|uniref:hypothetical protein n=1 Tax=Bernardetia sp. ABR2-2B TaxID=3127472 RepID=UPI0030CE5D62